MYKRKANKKTNKYLINAPTINEKDYSEHIEALDNAIKSKDVLNIGIVAPYASGKSSIVKTYKNVYRPRKIVEISLANFKGGEKEDKKEKESLAEKSILEQLLYSVGPCKVPSSNIKRIKAKMPLWIFTSFFIALTIALIACLILEANKMLPASDGSHFYWILFFSIISSIISLLFIFIAFNRIKISYSNIEVEISNNKDGFSLNMFIDEIIYFFKMTRNKIVVFEDIDRFESIKLLSKLREINQIINSNSYYKNHKPVKFVYCVNDGIFASPEDRAKFFDFVISPHPILTSANMTQIINESLESITAKINISDSFITGISLFIKDKRILNNIINDTILYKTSLKIEGDNNNEDEKLFAMMIYKNMYYSDYARLQKSEGRLYSLFNSYKQIAIKETSNALETEISTLENDIKDKNNENETNILLNRLSFSIFGIIIKYGQQQPYSIPKGYRDVGEFINLNEKITGFFIRNNNGNYPHSMAVEEISKHYGENIYDAKEKILQSDASRKIKSLYEKRERLRTLKLISAKEIIEKNMYNNEANTILNECPFLRFAIFNGYIDETYFKYVGKIDSKVDSELITRIISGQEIPLNQEIEYPDYLIRRIKDDYFISPRILNFYLVDKLIESDDFIGKRNAFINCLLLRSEKTIDFIYQYYKNNHDVFELINICHSQYPQILFDLFQHKLIERKDKDEIIVELVIKYGADTIAKVNTDSFITHYIENHSSPISSLATAFSSDSDFFNLLEKLKVSKIKHLNYNENSPIEIAIFEEATNNGVFEINIDNLLLIAKESDITVSFFLKNNNKKIREFFEKNKSDLINTIIEKCKTDSIKTSEDEDIISSLMLDNTLPLQIRCSFIEIIDNDIDYTSGLEIDIYNKLLKCNKYHKWEDLYLLSKIQGVDFSLIESNVANNINAMKGIISDKNFVIKIINSKEIKTNINEKQIIINAIKENITFSINEILDDEWLSQLILNNRIVSINQSSLMQLKNKHKSLMTILNKNNDYINSLGATSLGSSDYIDLLKQNSSETTKAKIIVNYYNVFINDVNETMLKSITEIIEITINEISTTFDFVYTFLTKAKSFNNKDLTERWENIGLKRLNDKELIDFIRIIDNILYNVLINNGNPVTVIRISKELANNNKCFQLLADKGILSLRTQNNWNKYRVDVSKLLEIINQA